MNEIVESYSKCIFVEDDDNVICTRVDSLLKKNADLQTKLDIAVDEIKYEGITYFGGTWTVRYLVAGIVEIFSGWFERGSQPEPMKFEGTPI